MTIEEAIAEAFESRTDELIATYGRKQAEEAARVTAIVAELEAENEKLKQCLHELVFFQHRADGRLQPQYEDGWNDAVSAMTKKAREYFTAQDVDADTFVDENMKLRAENERLKADAARLDAMEEKIDVVRHFNGLWSAIAGTVSYGGFPTLRAAIDAAMNESEEK